jgi:aldehyde dehydrogenase (NAD+)
VDWVGIAACLSLSIPISIALSSIQRPSSMAFAYTTDEEVGSAYRTLRATFSAGKTKSIPWRKWQLKQLWWLVTDNKNRLLDALHADLNKHSYESSFTEYAAVVTDILDHLEHIDDWTTPKRPEGASFSTAYLMGATVRPEPRGLVLIIGPWNFPIHLILLPLVAAVTAGCTVLLKPSELATATQACLADLIPQYMDTDAIRVVTGGPTETARLLQKQFDHIFFTGSPSIARHVSIAAAKHLTPTVLELGGQGPSVVTASADIDFAAKSIAATKHINAGQICLAVNHVLAHPSIADKLIERMQFHLKDFGVDGSESMTKIINRKNFDRLKTVMDTTNGSIAYGGVTNHDTLEIQPTILTDIKPNGSPSLLSMSTAL